MINLTWGLGLGNAEPSFGFGGVPAAHLRRLAQRPRSRRLGAGRSLGARDSRLGPVARAGIGVEAGAGGAVQETLAGLVAQEVAGGLLEEGRAARFGPDDAQLRPAAGGKGEEAR